MLCCPPRTRPTAARPALAHEVGVGGPLAERAVGEGERPPVPGLKPATTRCGGLSLFLNDDDGAFRTGPDGATDRRLLLGRNQVHQHPGMSVLQLGLENLGREGLATGVSLTQRCIDFDFHLWLLLEDLSIQADGVNTTGRFEKAITTLAFGAFLTPSLITV